MLQMARAPSLLCPNSPVPTPSGEDVNGQRRAGPAAQRFESRQGDGEPLVAPRYCQMKQRHLDAARGVKHRIGAVQEGSEKPERAATMARREVVLSQRDEGLR
jgi:hypothetical protein